MTFKDYLISKKTILVVFFSIHFLALFVNFFGIRGEYTTSPCSWDAAWSSKQKSSSITNYFFTDEYYSYAPYEYQSNFWPFVKFTYYAGYCDGKYGKSFRGLFRYYDHSEILAYSALLFLVLYIGWRRSLKVNSKK